MLALSPLLADPFTDQERGLGLLRLSSGRGVAPGQDVWGPEGALGWDLWCAGAVAQPAGWHSMASQEAQHGPPSTPHRYGAFSSCVCRGVRDWQRPPPRSLASQRLWRNLCTWTSGPQSLTERSPNALRGHPGCPSLGGLDRGWAALALASPVPADATERASPLRGGYFQ